MVGDTDPSNPVHNLARDRFPIGAALTVAYGSDERPFTTLGNLYRILGYLTGDCPDAPDINKAIETCRGHVRAQLPDDIPPPPMPVDLDADMDWLAEIMQDHPVIHLNPISEGDPDA